MLGGDDIFKKKIIKEKKVFYKENKDMLGF
jgi:hypothetical protein